MRELGERLRGALAELPGVIEVRGRGLMIGFDLDGGDAPDVVLRRCCAASGWSSTRPGPQTVRLLPPLIIDRAQADDALERIAPYPCGPHMTDPTPIHSSTDAGAASYLASPTRSAASCCCTRAASTRA